MASVCYTKVLEIYSKWTLHYGTGEHRKIFSQLANWRETLENKTKWSNQNNSPHGIEQTEVTSSHTTAWISLTCSASWIEVIRRILTSDGQIHIHDECKVTESKYSEFFHPQDSVTVIRHIRLHAKAGVLYLLRQNASYWIMRNLIFSSNSLIIVIYDFIQPLC